MFHNTFLKILRGEDELEVIYNKVQKLCAVIDYNLLEKTPEMAVKLAPIMMQNMKKDPDWSWLSMVKNVESTWSEKTMLLADKIVNYYYK